MHASPTGPPPHLLSSWMLPWGSWPMSLVPLTSWLPPGVEVPAVVGCLESRSLLSWAATRIQGPCCPGLPGVEVPAVLGCLESRSLLCWAAMLCLV